VAIQAASARPVAGAMSRPVPSWPALTQALPKPGTRSMTAWASAVGRPKAAPAVAHAGRSAAGSRSPSRRRMSWMTSARTWGSGRPRPGCRQPAGPRPLAIRCQGPERGPARQMEPDRLGHQQMPLTRRCGTGTQGLGARPVANSSTWGQGRSPGGGPSGNSSSPAVGQRGGPSSPLLGELAVQGQAGASQRDEPRRISQVV
jgi:hypothetical protein